MLVAATQNNNELVLTKVNFASPLYFALLALRDTLRKILHIKRSVTSPSQTHDCSIYST